MIESGATLDGVLYNGSYLGADAYLQGKADQEVQIHRGAQVSGVANMPRYTIVGEYSTISNVEFLSGYKTEFGARTTVVNTRINGITKIGNASHIESSVINSAKIGDRVAIHFASMEYSSVVGDDSRIEGMENHAILVGQNTVLGTGASVSSGANIGGGVQCGDGVAIGPNSRIEEGAVLGYGAAVGAGSVVGSRANVGPQAQIQENSKVDAGSIVEPGQVVQQQSFFGRFFS